MSIVDIITRMPYWYLLILILFSLYYSIRGIMEKKKMLSDNKYRDWSFTEKLIIEYVQEFLFKAIFTASGFMALFVANYIFSATKSVTDLSTGTSIILIFLLIWGISGVSGYLPYLVIRGKLPGVK